VTTVAATRPPPDSSRVVEVLNDTAGRVYQEQAAASRNHADYHVQQSLARQQEVLATTTAAIEVQDQPLPSDITTTAIANVGAQLIASTVDLVVNERRPAHSEAQVTVTVQDVSAVTQNAIALAVNNLPPNSNDVEVLMTAKAIVNQQANHNANVAAAAVASPPHLDPNYASIPGPPGALHPDIAFQRPQVMPPNSSLQYTQPQ
jgi:hypothetical protein